MADSNKTNFPQIPAKVWWQIRRYFKRKIPSELSPSSVATLLGVKEVAAKTYCNELQKLGLLDESYKPTDLVFSWRDDEKYADTCQKILETAYPQELTELAPAGVADRDTVVRWFMNSARLGEGSAKNRASTYLLIAKGDPSEEQDAANTKASNTSKTSKAAPKKDASSSHQKENGRASSTDKVTNATFSPSLQLNIQIHISADATSDQIETIFSSMARHLKDG